MRQSVISVYKNLGNDVYSEAPELDIVFRQPNHNFGLAYSFNFTKSFLVPFSTCSITIENVSQKLINAFAFDPHDLLTRPKIEIRAGDVNYTMSSIQDLDTLKGLLSLIYTGHPYYFTETKLPGARTLLVQCSDMATSESTNRVNDQFATNTPILSVLEKLLNGYKYDFSDITSYLSGMKLKQDYYINNLNLFSEVLPDLADIYEFFFYRTEKEVFKFIPNETPTTQSGKTVNNLNGLIEYPTTLNWNFWSIKTFFARPRIFYPGQWMTVDATTLNYSQTGRNSYHDFGVKTGLITEAKYNFNDVTAEINYTFSPSGNPIAEPIFAL